MVNTKRDAAWHWYLAKVDTPYKWGGNEIRDGGFDCSGLTNGAARKFGVTDRDYRAADLAEMFPKIGTLDLRPGDWLFWKSKTTGAIVHVEAVYAILDGKVYSIGASGGGPWITTLSAAQRADARVKIDVTSTDWAFAVNPWGD